MASSAVIMSLSRHYIPAPDFVAGTIKKPLSDPSALTFLLTTMNSMRSSDVWLKRRNPGHFYQCVIPIKYQDSVTGLAVPLALRKKEEEIRFESLLASRLYLHGW